MSAGFYGLAYQTQSTKPQCLKTSGFGLTENIKLNQWRGDKQSKGVRGEDSVIVRKLLSLAQNKMKC